MKLLKLIFFLAATLTIIFLNGCVQTTKGEVTPPSFTPSFPAVARTPTFFFTPTELTEPVITDPLTPKPTMTQTPIPTLELEKAEELLQEFLANNGNCDLPCLWGIIPGISSYHDVRALLEPFRGYSEYPVLDELNPESGSMDFSQIEGDLEFHTHVAYLAETQVVSRVRFDVSMFQRKLDTSSGEYWLGVYDSNLFRQRFQAYGVSAVLSKLGVPGEVVISTDGGPARGRSVPGFYVLILYPDHGVIARYTTFRQLVDGNVTGCLANAHVEFELFPAGQADSFSDNVDSTEWADWWPVPDDSPYWKSIEEATTMSLQEFYEAFRQPTDTCLETPANIWYLPG